MDNFQTSWIIAQIMITQNIKWKHLNPQCNLNSNWIQNSSLIQMKYLKPKTFKEVLCRNPSLGLATKARGLQGCGPRRKPGGAKSVREWTLTLPNELPLWELESQMDFRIFSAQLQGSKPIVSKNSLCHLKATEM
jgi:hypothetical protein